MKSISILAMLTVGCAIFCELGFAGEALLSGRRYVIVQPMYLMAIYDSLGEKKISKDTAQAYLHAERYYDKSEVAFQREIPTGTIMTILGPAPKVWSLPFFASRYFVHLEPDLSRGLDIIMQLDRGIEGDMDGLNPRLFEKR